MVTIDLNGNANIFCIDVSLNKYIPDVTCLWGVWLPIDYSVSLNYRIRLWKQRRDFQY